MTNNEQALMRSQNWYPAFKINRGIFNSIPLSYYEEMQSVITFPTGWCETPQGYDFWLRVRLSSYSIRL